MHQTVIAHPYVIGYAADAGVLTPSPHQGCFGLTLQGASLHHMCQRPDHKCIARHSTESSFSDHKQGKLQPDRSAAVGDNFCSASITAAWHSGESFRDHRDAANQQVAHCAGQPSHQINAQDALLCFERIRGELRGAQHREGSLDHLLPCTSIVDDAMLLDMPVSVWADLCSTYGLRTTCVQHSHQERGCKRGKGLWNISKVGSEEETADAEPVPRHRGRPALPAVLAAGNPSFAAELTLSLPILCVWGYAQGA